MSKPAFVSQVSKDIGGLPTWLNQHELQSFILESNPKVQDIIKIVSRSEIFSQNVLSVQIQVKLTDNSTQVLNYLVKSNEQTTSISSTPKFPRPYNFKLELHMYNEVLPALKNLYKNVGKQITFSPDNHSSKGSNHLYLANLQTKGYRTIIQPKGLRKSAMIAILSKLAAYHAATACYLQLTPTHLKAQLKRNLGNETDGEIIQRKTLLQRKFSESLRSNGLQHYEDKVKYYLKNLPGSIDTPDLKRSFNVISIGACWPNNILGSFDAFGEVKDVVFIDFGNSSYRSAAHDLFEILLTVPVEKTENFDAFLRYYHDELLINLKLLKFKGNLPTLTDLQLDLLNYGYEGFQVVMEILPIVLADFESTDIEDPFRTKNYSEEIKNLLPWMENRAYFEVETEPIMLY
ncbi:uncharacterized protein LOC117574595 [Drosophila albomicans]|uniref:Uncharacterized protein LOC117574595 n=1 Tax=Drosophila albomicans TaxID=7291 RepID=A0A6P8XSN7_DROAB|nr:uncharacterized protein LOC117574595 [Drosophila albomicans]